MAYDFQKLADVELLEEVPDGASAFVAVNGDVKRVPGSGLGGGGVATAILRLSSESNASAKAVTRVAVQPTVKKLPITCDNYTYEQARAVLEAGNPLTAMIFISEANMSEWTSCSQIAFLGNYISMTFPVNINNYVSLPGKPSNEQTFYWNADGFFDGEPADYNP